MRRLRLGYVGCGFMAQKAHIPNFVSIPECELMALAEVCQGLGRIVRGHLQGIPLTKRDHLGKGVA